jgi:hypothetical protein
MVVGARAPDRADGVGERRGMVGRIVHVKKDAFDVYIGRGRSSRWGNPFRIGEEHPVTGGPIRRGEAVALYRDWILRGEGRWLLRHLGELEGKILGCFCARTGGVGVDDSLVCHGQVLLQLLAWRGKKIREKRMSARLSESP